ncbi:hypothetical protein [Streptomyces sp. XD-27]|uniref:hypothetical protein n=1 Tax=Streptomyces sp. XD-27 TaxID=3062779 RepID=UPI0026F43797|nr:hypothetical protein [Streptomyces sp. XD-27]WKX72031.1 hypothetical protein Q3Y56_20885 [Streptomyces sp. XD-27]
MRGNVNKSVARVVLAAAVAATLGTATACEDSKDDKPAGRGSQKPAATETHKTLGKAELEQAVLAKADVKAKGYAIKEMTKAELAEGDAAKSDKAVCQPAVALMGSKYSPEPADSVYRTLGKGDLKTKESFSGMLRVSSYAAGGAEKTIADLKKAVEGCKGGFTATDGSGEKQKFTAVTAQPAAKLGDEALAFDMSGDGLKFSVKAVRSGAHVTVLLGFNMLDPMKSQVPQELVTAQVAKLEKAIAKNAG